jgi:hypothetical protein
MDGKNVADFIDPDIMARLEELEAEEDAREAAGEYDSDPEEDEESQSIRSQAAEIRDRKQSIRFSARAKTSRNHPVIPQKVRCCCCIPHPNRHLPLPSPARALHSRNDTTCRCRFLLSSRRYHFHCASSSKSTAIIRSHPLVILHYYHR